jgi:MFS family permease
MVRNRLKEGIHFDAYTGLGCGGVVLALFFGPWIERNLSPSWHWLVSAVFGVGALLVLWVIVQFFKHPGRAARKHVVPLLARSLAPLRLLEDEVALCRNASQGRWKIRRHVRVDVLWQKLQKRELTSARVVAAVRQDREGCGGQPGMKRSTGSSEAAPFITSGWST